MGPVISPTPGWKEKRKERREVRSLPLQEEPWGQKMRLTRASAPGSALGRLSVADLGMSSGRTWTSGHNLIEPGWEINRKVSQGESIYNLSARGLAGLLFEKVPVCLTVFNTQIWEQKAPQRAELGAVGSPSISVVKAI